MWVQELRDGYPFQSIIFPYNKPRAIVIMEQPSSNMIDYIKNEEIDQICIDLSNVDCSFLSDLAHIKHLEIDFRSFQRATQKKPLVYDLTPLYKLKNLLSIRIQDSSPCDKKLKAAFDVSRVDSLLKIAGESQYFENIEDAFGLKSLLLAKWKGEELPALKNPANLDTISISFSNIRSLFGIEKYSQLRCIYLTRCNKLTDITQLSALHETITAIRFEDCTSISSFSSVGSLTNLELLEISGNFELPNLNFIHKNHPKTFILGAKVMDNDLTPCLDMQLASLLHSYRSYNLKDSQLPKGQPTRGNNGIEEWRRQE